MLKIASIVILLAVAAPATAQAPAASASQPAAKPQVNPLDKIVCRTEEGLGSRLNKKKVCMSVREWKDHADDSREAAERIQQSQGMIPSG